MATGGVNWKASMEEYEPADAIGGAGDNTEFQRQGNPLIVLSQQEISEAQSEPNLNNLEVPVPEGSPITEAASTPSATTPLSTTPLNPAFDVFLEQLYKYITTSLFDPESREAVWVSSAYPSQISLKIRNIQKIVNPLECMDTESLNLAIRKMVREESNNGNLANSNPLGCKIYVSVDFARYAISEEDGHTKMEASILHECVDQHSASNLEVLCIPVIHYGHWTLYAFNMEDENLSILDPLPNPMCHKDIRLKVCKALETVKAKSNMFKNKFCDFSNWKHEFVEVPQQKNSYDSGFLVFNFMRHWDGRQLEPSVILTDSRMMRKEFLAYVLSFKDNEAYELPHGVSDLIKRLPSGPAWTRRLMDSKLLNVVREGNADKFRGLESNQGTRENVSDLDSMILSGITIDGDGVLHIAARFGYLRLIKDILFKLGMLPHQSDAGILSESNNWASTVMSEERAEESSSPNATESNKRANTIIVEERCNSSAAERNNQTSAVIAEQGRSPSAPGPGNDAAETCVSIESADPVQVVTFLMLRNCSGETCLHEAVRSGHQELVKLLISVDGDMRKKNVNDNELKKIAALTQVVDYRGVSPLYLATELRNDTIVKVLLSDNVSSPSYAGPGGTTALHAAVLLDAELTKQLVLWKPDLQSKADKVGNTPLHFVASARVPSVAEILLPPPDANHPDSTANLAALTKKSNGWYPIHVAAASGKLGVIKQLLKVCPDCMWARDASGQSFLHVAVREWSLNVVDYVCTEKTLFQILNMTDHDGNTALHLAVKSGNQRSFCSLMKNMRLCLSISNKKGRTPRDVASFNLAHGLSSFMDSKTLIYLHLRLARADYGTYRGYEFTDNMTEDVYEAKLSESISKCAGLMAVCAVFILNMSVTAFFSVAGPRIGNTGPVAPSPAPAPAPDSRNHQPIRDFKLLIICDSIAFVSSALSAFCCMFAGIYSIDIRMGRAYLKLAGFSLYIASSAMVCVFLEAAYSAYALFDTRITNFIGWLVLISFVPIAMPLFGMFTLHVRTLLHRLILLTIILPSKKYMLEKSSVALNILKKTSGFLSYRPLRRSTIDD